MEVASGAISDSMDEWLHSEHFELLGYFAAQVWHRAGKGGRALAGLQTANCKWVQVVLTVPASSGQAELVPELSLTGGSQIKPEKYHH